MIHVPTTVGTVVGVIILLVLVNLVVVVAVVMVARRNRHATLNITDSELRDSQ